VLKSSLCSVASFFLMGTMVSWPPIRSAINSRHSTPHKRAARLSLPSVSCPSSNPSSSHQVHPPHISSSSHQVIRQYISFLPFFSSHKFEKPRWEQERRHQQTHPESGNASAVCTHFTCPTIIVITYILITLHSSSSFIITHTSQKSHTQVRCLTQQRRATSAPLNSCLT